MFQRLCNENYIHILYFLCVTVNTISLLTLYPTWLVLQRCMNIMMYALTATSLLSIGVAVGDCRVAGILDKSPISSRSTEAPAFSGDSRKGEREARRSLSCVMPSWTKLAECPMFWKAGRKKGDIVRRGGEGRREEGRGGEGRRGEGRGGKEVRVRLTRMLLQAPVMAEQAEVVGKSRGRQGRERRQSRADSPP